jgi:hypothetical protein
MGAATALIGSIGQWFLTSYGIEKEEEAAAKQTAILGRQYREEQAEARRQFDISSGRTRQQQRLQAKQLKFQEKEAARAWKWKEEERGYQRGVDFVNKMNTMIDRKNNARTQFANIWRNR